MAPGSSDSLALALSTGVGSAEVVDSGANNYTYTGKAGLAGNGLFAAKGFGPGELVLKLEADVTSVLDSPRLGVACEWCFVTVEEVDGGGDGSEREVKLRKCGGCGVVRVCGEVGLEVF